MIPYLLAAIGGYLIGESTKSKFLDNAANGSVADAGLEVASASVLEKGGLYGRGGRLNVPQEEKRLGILNYDETETYLQNKYKGYKYKSIFIRAGLPPIKKDGLFGNSRNGITGIKEIGVSVFKAKYSYNSGFVFVNLEEGGVGSDINLAYRDSMFNEDDFSLYEKYERKIYLVEGSVVGYGSDGEPLLNNKTIKIVGTIDPNKVVPTKSFLKEYLGGINVFFGGKEFKEYPKYKQGGL